MLGGPSARTSEPVIEPAIETGDRESHTLEADVDPFANTGEPLGGSLEDSGEHEANEANEEIDDFEILAEADADDADSAGGERRGRDLAALRAGCSASE